MKNLILLATMLFSYGIHGQVIYDVEGNKYKTVKIGTQTWMAENLNTSTYSNGDPIPNVKEYYYWEKLKTGAWCYYNGNPANETPYGKLYNFYTIVDSRNVCPRGWHVPNDKEWTILIDYLGGKEKAGGKMKSTDTGQYWDWERPNTATNSSGFSGQPGGYRSFNGTYYNAGKEAGWWSAGPLSPSALTGSNWFMSTNNGGVGKSEPFKQQGSSVRCVMD